MFSQGNRPNSGNSSFYARVFNVSTVKKTDLELIAESVDGQTHAFDLLVTRYQDRLYNALSQILRNREDARDVVQDAFVLSWSKLDTFRGDANFYSWLFRVAYNVAMSRQRKKRVKTVGLRPAERERIDLPADKNSADPSQNLQVQERQSQVQAALADLPEEFRTVLILKEIEDFKYEQIAEILNVPLGTIRSRIYRARILLRERLTRLLADEEFPGKLNTTTNT